MGKQWKQWQFILGGSKTTADGDCSHEIKRCLLLGRKAMIKLDSILISKDVTLPIKVHLVKAMVLSSSHIWMWELDCEEGLSAEGLILLNCGAGEDSWESLDCKDMQPVHPKGDHPWIFIGRTDAEAETPILWPPDAKNWLIGKTPWCWERLKVEGKGDDTGWHGWMAWLM